MQMSPNPKLNAKTHVVLITSGACTQRTKNSINISLDTTQSKNLDYLKSSMKKMISKRQSLRNKIPIHPLNATKFIWQTLWNAVTACTSWMRLGKQKRRKCYLMRWPSLDWTSLTKSKKPFWALIFLQKLLSSLKWFTLSETFLSKTS